MRSIDEIARYAAFYKYLPHRAHLQWQLINADDPKLITAIEKIMGCSQKEAVDDFLEESCWSEDFPHLTGHKGSAEERRNALRAAYLRNLKEDSKAQQIDYGVLTPFEAEMANLLYEVLHAFPADPKHPHPTLEKTRRVLERVRALAARLMAERIATFEKRLS